MAERLLEIRNLTVRFGRRRPFIAVNDVSFDIYRGETFGLVGESGSGKTTIGRAIIRVCQASEGEILYRGERISGKIPKSLDRALTRRIQMIFQDPMASLNERAKVSYIVSEGIYRSDGKRERAEKVSQALRDVGLLPEFAGRFPHEFSGGQRQRIVIARALATSPHLLLCDEAVSALDVSVRAQVLNLFETLKEELDLTYVFVSHDMSVLEHICDRVAIMYLGKIVEIGDKDTIFNSALHPYTQALLSAVPSATDDGPKRERIILEGDIPSPVNPPEGCHFRTRCPYATEECMTEPELTELGNGHCVACHRCKAD